MAVWCVLGMVPILLWNASHNWVSSGQMAERVGLTSRSNWWRLLPLLGFLAGEVVVLGGVWWFVGVRAPGERRRHVRGRDESGGARVGAVGAALSGLPLGGGLVGLRGGEPARRERGQLGRAWVRVGAGVSGWWLARGAFRNGLTRPASRWGWVGVGFWALSLFNLTASGTPNGLPGRGAVHPGRERPDPHPCDGSIRPVGCGATGGGAQIERCLAERRSRGENPFVLTPTYTMASALSFYLPGQPEVYCLSFSWTPWRPVNQHDLWHPNPRFDPDAFRGRPVVIVEDAQFHPSYAGGLGQTELHHGHEPPTRLLVRKNGVAVAAWDVSIGHNYRGRPGDIR